MIYQVSYSAYGESYCFGGMTREQALHFATDAMTHKGAINVVVQRIA